jgi:hypothetical protein
LFSRDYGWAAAFTRQASDVRTMHAVMLGKMQNFRKMLNNGCSVDQVAPLHITPSS